MAIKKEKLQEEEMLLVERALEIEAGFNRDNNITGDDNIQNLEQTFRKVININFRIVYQPRLKCVGAFIKRVRFGVGAGQLQKYIGQNNALRAAINAFDAGADKYSFKHRKYGTVDFYSK